MVQVFIGFLLIMAGVSIWLSASIPESKSDDHFQHAMDQIEKRDKLIKELLESRDSYHKAHMKTMDEYTHFIQKCTREHLLKENH